jgi:hypothetical protein
MSTLRADTGIRRFQYAFHLICIGVSCKLGCSSKVLHSRVAAIGIPPQAP